MREWNLHSDIRAIGIKAANEFVTLYSDAVCSNVIGSFDTDGCQITPVDISAQVHSAPPCGDERLICGRDRLLALRFVMLDRSR